MGVLWDQGQDSGIKCYDGRWHERRGGQGLASRALIPLPCRKDTEAPAVCRLTPGPPACPLGRPPALSNLRITNAWHFCLGITAPTAPGGLGYD